MELKRQVEVFTVQSSYYECTRVDFLVPFTSIKDTCIDSFWDWYALGVL